MSLLEVMIGLATLGIVAVGVLASLMQSRRLTEGSIRQNTAVTAAQGYVEQLKNMEFAELDLNPVPTLLDQGTPDPLTVSPLPRSTSTQIVNNRLLDINNTPTNPNDDMPLQIVLYLEDITDPANDVGRSRLITINYTWQFQDGASTRTFSNSVTAIRSHVPTF